MKLIGEAVVPEARFQHDKVRRDEVKSRPELKRSRYLWLRNENNLTSEQSAQLGSLSRTNLKTARAYHLRLTFQDIYKERSRAWAAILFDKWYAWARRCRLQPMKDVAATMLRHRDGILASWRSQAPLGRSTAASQTA